MKNIFLILLLSIFTSASAQVVENYWSYEGDPNIVYYESKNTSTGRILEEGVFVGGKRDGAWKRYYESGTLEHIAYFDNGLKTGFWKFYDEQGKVIMIKRYKNDDLILAEQRRYY